MKHTLLILSTLFFLFSCSSDDTIKDYTEENKQEILTYLADNNLTADVDEYGIYYIIEEEGTGENPSNSDIVKINYEGSFTDGDVFRTNDGNSVYLSLQNILIGLTYGIPHFKKGGSGKIILPSNLAYGDGSVVIFDIELNDFFTDTESANDDEIVTYLANNNLTATKTDSGLYYIIEKEGTGVNPTSDDTVTVAYKGYYTNEFIFDESSVSGISFSLQGVIQGWTEGIPYFKEGGSGKLLIPSSLGYNDGLVRIFDVDLISVSTN